MKKALVVLVLFVLVIIVALLLPVPAQADGFVDFENGTDGAPIRSTIPGLQFTTTQGYDWIYGDWRTGNYNGPYPNGPYYSNGNFFAWLGPNQGAGRIDFTEGCATYLQVWVSSHSGLHADAYYSNGVLAATASVAANLSTGRLARLRVDAPSGGCFSYVLLHDTGNYWLIDDLSTDAGGVPATRPSVVIIPGLKGSKLNNVDSCQNEDYEVWPDATRLLTSPSDEHLRHLLLSPNGSDPASTCDHIYPAGIIREVSVGPANLQFYGPLIDYLIQAGYDVHIFDYDWRLDLRDTADRLDDFINDAINETGKVNIVDHSLGGLLARYYVTSNAARSAKVEQVISLGTPFLGAPEALKVFRWGDDPLFSLGWLNVSLVHPERIKELARNSPAAYQILPSSRYFNVSGGGYYRVSGQMRNESQTRAVIQRDHNGLLAVGAEQFHSAAMDDWNSTSLPVAFRLIVGSGKEDTPGVLHEYVVSNWFGRTETVVDLEPTNGDGTVPTTSATLRGNGYDYSGGTPTWYTNDLDHGGLIKAPYVLQFIGAMLATPPNNAALLRALPSTVPAASPSMALYRGARALRPTPMHQDTVPPTPPEMGLTPFVVDGGQISAFGAVAVHVYDGAGNHTGPTADGLVELGIAGSSYTTAGDAIFVTVPGGGNYRTRVESLGDERFDLRIRNLRGTDAHLVQRTISYTGAPIGASGVAELQYAPNQPGGAPSLALDINNDGTVDVTMPPTGDVGQAGSTDRTAPTISAQLDGQVGPYGWYVGTVTVTISVTDGGSGVAMIAYSIDRGQNVQTYNGPFAVQADDVSYVIVQATDRAGNQAWDKVAVGPIKTFLPVSTQVVAQPAAPIWRAGAGLSGRIVYDLSSTDATCTTLFAATDSGAYRSADSGQSWTPLHPLAEQLKAPQRVFDDTTAPSSTLTPAIVVCPANPTVVYLTQWGGGVYRSGDGGATWQPRSGGLGDRWIYALAVNPVNCDIVYAATNESGVWKTANGGVSWQPRNSGLGNPASRSIVVAPGNSNRLFVGTTSGVWRSDNGGDSWTAAATLPAAPVRALVVARSDAARVFAAVEGAGVFLSSDAGGSWQERNAGLVNRQARTLAIDPRDDQTVVVGIDNGGGVYRSNNSGQSWTPLNDGLANRNVKQLWLDGGTCDGLHAGTTNGAWYLRP